MESLNNTKWDVVISGTSLSQSLLALALSRSGKKVLHVDRNDYYGGIDAALSLQDAETWVKVVNDEQFPSDKLKIANDNGDIPSPSIASAHTGLYDGASTPVVRGEDFTARSIFRDAQIITADVQNGSSATSDNSTKLSFSRAYSLCLSPQLIYTRSVLLPILVSSKIYRQLEFLAVGCWWIYERDDQKENRETPKEHHTTFGRLKKIPGSREDVFADESIDLISKRHLMRFLRLATDVEVQASAIAAHGEKSFQEYLTSQYHIPPRLQSALHALTLSPQSANKTPTSFAIPRIAQNLNSIGVFGPGFGSVIPKWGGTAEIAQVACRAGAVGGGVYVLGKGIESVDHVKGQESEVEQISTVSLQDGEKMQTRWIVGHCHDLPPSRQHDRNITHSYVSRSITIVASNLSSLFSPSAEGVQQPAGAIVVFPTGSLPNIASILPADVPPVYLMIHSSDTGECPAGQCVIYSSTSLSGPSGHELLELAIQQFVVAVHEDHEPEVLWTLRYSQLNPQSKTETLASETAGTSSSNNTLVVPEPAFDLVLDDSLIERLEMVWQSMNVGTQGFMHFDERENGANDDEPYS